MEFFYYIFYYTPFHIACENSSGIGIAEYLIQKGVDINSKTDKGLTGFFIACQKCNNTLIDFLVEKGADINCKNEENDFFSFYLDINKLRFSLHARKDQLI